MTLFMQGPAAEANSGVPLVVGGAAPIQQGGLFMPEVIGEDDGVPLYVRGW